MWDGMEQDEARWDETGWDGMGSHTPAGRQLGMLLGWQHLDADPGSSGAGPALPSLLHPLLHSQTQDKSGGTKTQRRSSGMGTEGLLRKVNIATTRGYMRSF